MIKEVTDVFPHPQKSDFLSTEKREIGQLKKLAPQEPITRIFPVKKEFAPEGGKQKIRTPTRKKRGILYPGNIGKFGEPIT